jgi:hypothetical protein
MKNIDWPLAITLAIVFVVMSVFRWRYFKSLARRRQQAQEARDAQRTPPPPDDDSPKP